MRAVIGLVLSLSLPLQTNAQEVGEVPRESQTTLEQLRDWELQQRANLEKEITRKRAEVREVLRRHLETYTKRGELAAANAIQREIDRLESDERRPPSEMQFSLPWKEGNKNGEVWITFHKDGTATWDNRIVDKTFSKTFRWAFEDERTVELWSRGSAKGKGTRWSFTRDFQWARVRIRRGETTADAKRLK